MTEAGVAWQQYDLSDSEADDVDVARSQDGGPTDGLGRWRKSMKAMEVNSGPSKHVCFLGVLMLGTWE